MSVVNWSLLPIHIGPNERGMCTVIKIVLLKTCEYFYFKFTNGSVKLMRKSKIYFINLERF